MAPDYRDLHKMRKAELSAALPRVTAPCHCSVSLQDVTATPQSHPQHWGSLRCLAVQTNPGGAEPSSPAQLCHQGRVPPSLLLTDVTVLPRAGGKELPAAGAAMGAPSLGNLLVSGCPGVWLGLFHGFERKALIILI